MTSTAQCLFSTYVEVGIDPLKVSRSPWVYLLPLFMKKTNSFCRTETVQEILFFLPFMESLVDIVRNTFPPSHWSCYVYHIGHWLIASMYEYSFNLSMNPQKGSRNLKSSILPPWLWLIGEEYIDGPTLEGSLGTISSGNIWISVRARWQHCDLTCAVTWPPQ